jgi:copper chaperone NosL
MTACQSGTLHPASIEPGDICAFCKMAISQAGFAAQFIDKDGSTFKFDDIGCMIRYAREADRRNLVAAFFVMDYNDRRWLPAEQATYVKSGKIVSPMGSGLIGFRDRARAQDFAGKNVGRVLLFDDLWKAEVATPPHVPSNSR